MCKKMFCALFALLFFSNSSLSNAGIITPSAMQIVEHILSNNQEALLKIQASKQELQSTLKYNTSSQLSLKLVAGLVGLGAFVGNVVQPLGVVAQAVSPKLNDYFAEKRASYTASGVLIEKVIAETDQLILKCERVELLAKRVIDTADDEELMRLREAVADLDSSFGQLNQMLLEIVMENPMSLVADADPLRGEEEEGETGELDAETLAPQEELSDH